MSKVRFGFNPKHKNAMGIKCCECGQWIINEPVFAAKGSYYCNDCKEKSIYYPSNGCVIEPGEIRHKVRR